LLTFKIKEAIPQSPMPIHRARMSWRCFWKSTSSRFKLIMLGLSIIACVNSSDMFLLIQAGKMASTPSNTLYLYLWYNLVYTVFAYPLGQLSDRIGIKPLLLMGYGIMAFVYFAFIGPLSNTALYFVFALYGLYAAATEGLAKAWISQHCPADQRGQSLGLLSGIQSVGLLVSGSIYVFFSLINQIHWAFIITALGCIVGSLVLSLVQQHTITNAETKM